jgi:hypothetical protein
MRDGYRAMETLETEADALKSPVMYRECPFCGRTHRSAYVDELEAAVMACREKVAPEHRGSLEAWVTCKVLPIPPEVEAYAGTSGLI